MPRRLGAMEKLARDICWAGFSSEYRPEVGKAQYWEQMSDTSRKHYLTQASDIMFWTQRLGADRVAKALSDHQ